MNICINISGRVNPESGYSFSMFNFSERPLADILNEKIGYPVYSRQRHKGHDLWRARAGVHRRGKKHHLCQYKLGARNRHHHRREGIHGKMRFSGKSGHVNIFDNEILCHCGKKGCLETEASGRHCTALFGEGSVAEKAPYCQNELPKNPPTLDEIITADNKEDLLCIEIVEEIGQKLGRQIAGLISIFNPELVIIGGTLSSTGDYIVQPIKTAIRKYSLNLVNKDATVTVSKLKDKAGVVGACMLARSRMFEI